MIALSTDAIFWLCLTNAVTLCTGIGLGIAIADHWPHRDAG